MCIKGWSSAVLTVCQTENFENMIENFIFKLKFQKTTFFDHQDKFDNIEIID
jgi:hypothetical protein